MQPTAIDLFAGAGGATQGLRDAGFNVIGAVELEKHPAESYALNHPDAKLWTSDIRKVAAVEMRRQLGLAPGELTLLKACPPCQGFSSLVQVKRDDPRNDLVPDVSRFVGALRPKLVLIENVPGLARDARFAMISAALTACGYAHRTYIFECG